MNVLDSILRDLMKMGGTVKLERSGNLVVVDDNTAKLHSVPLDRATHLDSGWNTGITNRVKS